MVICRAVLAVFFGGTATAHAQGIESRRKLSDGHSNQRCLQPGNRDGKKSKSGGN
jgi:hypothetical protein